MGFVKPKAKRKSKKNLPAEKLYSLEIGASANLHTGKEEPIRVMFNEAFAEEMRSGKASDLPFLEEQS